MRCIISYTCISNALETAWETQRGFWQVFATVLTQVGADGGATQPLIMPRNGTTRSKMKALRPKKWPRKVSSGLAGEPGDLVRTAHADAVEA